MNHFGKIQHSSTSGELGSRSNGILVLMRSLYRLTMIISTYLDVFAISGNFGAVLSRGSPSEVRDENEVTEKR